MHAPDSATIEWINPDIPRGQIRSVLFDFDGTISLIRQGWQGVLTTIHFQSKFVHLKHLSLQRHSRQPGRSA